MAKEEKKKELTVSDLPGVGPSTAEKLAASGIDSLLAIAVCSIGVLTDEAGVSEAVARKMIQAARDMLDMGFETADTILEKRSLVKKIKVGSDSFNEMMGGGFETGAITEVTYDDLMRFSIDLDNNRTPKHTKIIKGSRMVDTQVVDSARVLYIGSELRPTVAKMADPFGNKAFIPVQHYAHSNTVMNGEIGTLDQFRIVVVPEMLHWAGKGAAVSSNAGYRSTNDKYDVFPMLCVGSESFTTIGFYDGGKGSKFRIFHKAPGKEMADLTNPYGEVGFMSIKWWYGTLILRPERLGLVKTVATI